MTTLSTDNEIQTPNYIKCVSTTQAAPIPKTNRANKHLVYNIM